MGHIVDKVDYLNVRRFVKVHGGPHPLDQLGIGAGAQQSPGRITRDDVN